MLWAKFLRRTLLLGCVLSVCGCDPIQPGPADEEKEPQFLIGRSRVNAMNFSGAIEAFEQALEMNPRSAAAHFELGWLYAEKEADPAAAIFHYQKYLKFRPAAANAETIKQHIFRLKQELARATLMLPPSAEIQRQLEQLTGEKRQLQEEVERLLRNGAVRAGPTNRVGLPVSPGRSNVVGVADRAVRAVTRPVGSRSHRVQAGDTLAAIARRSGVTLEALLAANPALNPRRLQVGQSINIPAH